jgi:hypothetical protein
MSLVKVIFSSRPFGVSKTSIGGLGSSCEAGGSDF